MEHASELISQVREHYLEQFVGFIAKQRERWPNGHAEVKFELSGESELFRKLYCTDFAANDGHDAIVREMFPDRILTFEPFSFEVRSVPVSIERLVWDDVQLHHNAASLGLSALDRWFDCWFDIEDARLDPASEIAEIVHSLSIKGGRLDIDFGTATAEALWDILDLVAASGATTIQVTSGREPVGH